MLRRIRSSALTVSVRVDSTLEAAGDA